MKKTLVVVIVLLIVFGAVAGYRLYQKVYAPNVELTAEEQLIFIPTGAGFETVVDSLRPYLQREGDFKWTAKRKHFTRKVKPGRYVIRDGMSNSALVDLLRAGRQKPLMLSFNNVKNVSQLAARLAVQLEPDSLHFYRYYTSADSLAPFDLSPAQIMGIFLPNSYEFYWNSSPGYTLQRMIKEHERFWKARDERREATGLSRLEVSTLASIVESETSRKDEMPRVAGLYLNRLERGIKLQSDPTVIYGIQRDKPGTEIRRVLFKHLRYESPYNTYIHKGLPPGPIRIPSIAAIESVLDHEDHEYIFMVADPERPGYHNFATNLRQHNRYRQQYIRWYEHR